MSKNLRGYSGTQVQINLDEITASSVTATNGNFTTLTIGTYAITTLNVSDLVASGVVKFTGITQQNPLNTDDHNILIHDPTTNRLYKFNSLQFSPINNQLSIHNLLSSGEIYYKNQTLDQRFEPLGGGGGSYVTTNTAQTISGIKTFQNKQEFYEIETTGDVDIGGNVSVNGNVVVTSLPQDNTDNNFRYITFQGVGNVLHGDSKLTFNPSTNTLSIAILNIGQLLTTSNNTFYSCMFQGNNNDISQAPPLANFHYNPSELKLKIDNVEVTDDLTVADDLTVTGRTDLGTIVSINNLNTTVTNTTYRVLLWDNTSSSSKTIRSDSNVYYDTTTNTLYSPNISGNITAQIRSGSTPYPVLFYDTGTNEICIDSSATQITYNPLSNILDVRNINVAVDLTVTRTTNVTAVNATANLNNRILFLSSNTETGDISNDLNLYYNPSSQTLTVPKIESDLSTTNIRCLSAGKIEFDSGVIEDHGDDVYLSLRGSNSSIIYNLAFWNTGEVRQRANPRYRWYIQDATTSSTFYQVMLLDKDGIRIYDHEDNSRVLHMQVDSSANDYGTFYSNSMGHTFRIGSEWKFRVSSSITTIYNDLNIGTGTANADVIVNGTSTFNDTVNMPQTVNFPSSLTSGGGNRQMRIPFIDVANTDTANRLMRIEGVFTYNPGDDEMTVTNITTTGEITYKGETLDARFGGSNATVVKGYVASYSCDAWSTTLGQPRYFGNDNYIEHDKTNANSTNPRISQYGQNFSVTESGTTYHSAINFQANSTYWKIKDNSYAGWWEVDVSIVYHNTHSTRVTPNIRIKKYDGSNWIEQPQISQGVQYSRNDTGELNTMRCTGPVYLSGTVEALRVYTKLKIGSIPNTGTIFGADTITSFQGNLININMKFLGNSSSNNETVNAL
jgi:hypothetical protein